MYYLVSFINCIAVQAPENTDESLIIEEARKWIEHNYKDNPMRMLGDCMSVDTDWCDIPCPNVRQGDYRARVLQTIMPDDDFGCCPDDTSQVIINEDGSIIHNNHT